MSKIMFLPQDYQAPKGANFYMKFQDGENKFRILSAPILGWEDWLDKKPVRFHFNEKPAKPNDPKKPVKHFWSMIVWNYNEEEIQILHVTQASIRNAIESFCNDTDWGAPYFYDIKVIRKGEALETEYTTNPVPHKKIHPMVVDRFNERRINLDALFDNDDPFAKDQHKYTEGMFDEQENFAADFSSKITQLQAQELTHILEDCDFHYQELIMYGQ